LYPEYENGWYYKGQLYMNENEKAMPDKKFWMIVGDGNTPKVRHTNMQDARNEMERLAKNNPGVTFYLLSAVESAVSGLVKTKL
jgi:hypothetical protein